ncbi:hypothetical protein GF339_01910, partial [candidate division KSB3 bacterium]|nr:hypothetical protein [candidate division KSB3 bacterium]MBD3323306.1 hypothetical protein [candidate division KSB3 bacterium]
MHIPTILQAHPKFSSLNKLWCIGVVLIGLMFLGGCGEDQSDVSGRVSGPGANSALPIRIDATPTPTPTMTPQTAEVADQDTTPTPEFDQYTPTPAGFPNETTLIATPVSEEDNPPPEAEASPSPTPSGQSSDSLSSKPSTSSDATQETSEPTPVPTVTPSPT